MRKLFIATLMLVTVLATSAHAADVWKYRVDEVRKPSLKAIEVRFTIILNGADYVYESVSVSPEELVGKTLPEKKIYLKGLVEALVDQYKIARNTSLNLEELVGIEIIY